MTTQCKHTYSAIKSSNRKDSSNSSSLVQLAGLLGVGAFWWDAFVGIPIWVGHPHWHSAQVG